MLGIAPNYPVYAPVPFSFPFPFFSFPETGRWDSPDLDAFKGGDTNLYRYCGNCPIDSVDPTGTDRWLFHSDLSPYFPSDLPVVGWLAHWYIVVPDSASISTGYAKLDWGPIPGYYVTRNVASPLIPGEYGVLEGRWSSNAAQDKALVDLWTKARDDSHPNPDWFDPIIPRALDGWRIIRDIVGYDLGRNCMTIALWYIDYGGDAGPAKKR